MRFLTRGWPGALVLGLAAAAAPGKPTYCRVTSREDEWLS
jgi:hypothetical protein